MMRMADVASVLPATAVTPTTRHNQERNLDPNIVAKHPQAMHATGALTAAAVTNTSETERVNKTDKDNKKKKREQPKGPLADLFSADAADESTFESAI